MPQSRLYDYGFPRVGAEVRRDKSPVHALCFYCGKEKLLRWIVDGHHACDDCKRHYEEKK